MHHIQQRKINVHCFFSVGTHAESTYYLRYLLPFKGKGCNSSASWIAGAPEGMVFSVAPSGWMKGFKFEAWFKSIFLKHFEDKENPVVLFFYGNVSHLMYGLIVAAKKRGVHIICLPLRHHLHFSQKMMAYLGVQKKLCIPF